MCYNGRRMKRLIWILILSLPSFSQSPQQIASGIESRLLSLRTLQADFEQTYYSATITSPLQERGQFTYQKPNFMRWQYEDPEQSIYIFREGVSLAFFPEENILYRHALTKEEQDSEIFAILTGKARLEDNYSIDETSFPSEKDSPLQVKLTPKHEGEFSHILLEVNEKTWLIERAIFFDWAGNKQEFRFTRIKVNPRISAKTFEVSIPPDCEVIDDLPPPRR